MSNWIFITMKLYRFWVRYELFIRKMMDLFAYFSRKVYFCKEIVI